MAGGIISGYLSGTGKALAYYGKVTLDNDIAKERDDANFLRDKELKKSARDFTTSERVAGQEFTASESEKDRQNRKVISDKKIKNKKDKDGSTNKMKNANALINQGYPKDVANAVAQGGFKQIKDENSGDMVLVNTLTGKESGRLTSDNQGNKKWLPTGEQPENAKVTKLHRKEAKDKAGDKAGVFSTDETDFPSTGGDRKEWAKKEAQRIANEERSGGIISSQLKPKPSKPDTGKPEMKTIGTRRISKNDYIEKMVKKYGKDKLGQIERQWLEYSAGQ